MKISEFVEKMEEIKKEHGDIHIMFVQSGGGEDERTEYVEWEANISYIEIKEWRGDKVVFLT
mgnify:CR=1 FL=1